ncbi:hypothetical protein [uncultured Pseudokineococcus sp.]
MAAHHLTDVLAGLALGGLWVLACALVLLPRAHERRLGGSGQAAP